MCQFILRSASSETPSSMGRNMTKSAYSKASLGALLAAVVSHPAAAMDFTVSGFDNTSKTLTGTDTLTVTSTGELDVPVTSGLAVVVNGGATNVSIEVQNGGFIDSHHVTTNTPNPLPAIFFAAPPGGHLSVLNSGSIEGVHLAFGTNPSGTGSTDFTNTSTGFLGATHFSGMPVTLSMNFGAGDDTFSNSGEVAGSIFMGLGDDTVNIFTGSFVNGIIYGDDGSSIGQETNTASIVANGGTINFIGSSSTKPLDDSQDVGRIELFRNVHFQSGYWTLTDDIYGGIFTVDAGATVEMRDDETMFREFVYTAFNDLGTPLVNNGHIVFYNDLTTYSTDDGLNINITGTGSLDLYNTAGASGVFQFGATGGFGGGLNLHGGTVLLVADYTGDINVMDNGVQCA